MLLKNELQPPARWALESHRYTRDRTDSSAWLP